MAEIHLRKIFFNCVILLTAMIVSGAILISAANYLPINDENWQESLLQLSTEGWFPEVPSTAGEFGSFQSMNPTALELATDNLMVKMALYDGNDSGYIQAFRCFSTHTGYQQEYSRYWHGYVVILRFLFMFFNYYEVRIINGICQVLIFSAIIHFLLNYKGLRYAMALGTSYMLLMPMALAQCLQYSWIFYVSFGALLVYLKFRTYLEQGERYIYFFLLTGAFTSYLDLLTYPLLTWGLVIVWWLLLQEREENVVDNIKKVIISAISWLSGYTVMWIGKWGIGSLVLKENLFKKAISEALLWTVNKGENAISLSDRLQALFINWKMYAYKLYIFILMVWILYVVIRGIWGYVKDPRIPALFLIGFSSIVWYIALAGHSTVHHIFTHKIYGVSIAAFLGIALVSFKGKPRVPSVKRLLRYFFITALTAGASYALTLQLKLYYDVDDYDVNNYAYTFDTVLVEDTISMDFTPAFAHISNMNIGISVEDGQTGEYRISLLDEKGIVYQDSVPVSEWAAGNLHGLAVDWDLTAGRQYTFRIDRVGTDGNTYLWVTAGGLMPLEEYGEISIGKKIISGQMLTDITYQRRFTGKYNCLFWTLTFFGICFMVIAVFQNSVIKSRDKHGIGGNEFIV